MMSRQMSKEEVIVRLRSHFCTKEFNLSFENFYFLDLIGNTLHVECFPPTTFQFEELPKDVLQAILAKIEQTLQKIRSILKE